MDSNELSLVAVGVDDKKVEKALENFHSKVFTFYSIKMFSFVF